MDWYENHSNDADIEEELMIVKKVEKEKVKLSPEESKAKLAEL